MLPTDKRLGTKELTGAHIKLREVVQHQCAAVAVDGPLQVQFDIVADPVRPRHLRAKGCDIAPTGTLGRTRGLVDPATRSAKSTGGSKVATFSPEMSRTNR